MVGGRAFTMELRTQGNLAVPKMVIFAARISDLLAASREHASGPIDSKRMLHTCCFQTCSRNLQPCPGATCSKFKFHKLPAGTDVESSVSTHFVGCVP